MDSQAEKISAMLYLVLIYDPLPGVTPQGAADYLGVKRDRLYKWAAGRNPLPAEFIAPLYEYTADPRVYQMTLPRGCSFLDNSRYEAGPFEADTSRLLADLTKEVSDVPVAFAEAIADGVIDEAELSGLVREGKEAQEKIEQMMIQARQKVSRQPMLRLEVA